MNHRKTSVIPHTLLLPGHSYHHPGLHTCLTRWWRKEAQFEVLQRQLHKETGETNLQQGHTCEASSSSAGHEISCILSNPEVHYLVHKSLPHVSILFQTNPVNALSHFIIILPSTPQFPKWLLSLRFRYQNTACISLLPHEHHQDKKTTRKILGADRGV